MVGERRRRSVLRPGTSLQRPPRVLVRVFANNAPDSPADAGAARKVAGARRPATPSIRTARVRPYRSGAMPPSTALTDPGVPQSVSRARYMPYGSPRGRVVHMVTNMMILPRRLGRRAHGRAGRLRDASDSGRHVRRRVRRRGRHPPRVWQVEPLLALWCLCGCACSRACCGRVGACTCCSCTRACAPWCAQAASAGSAAAAAAGTSAAAAARGWNSGGG